jgi:hypothetical protein
VWVGIMLATGTSGAIIFFLKGWVSTMRAESAKIARLALIVLG